MLISELVHAQWSDEASNLSGIKSIVLYDSLKQKTAVDPNLKPLTALLFLSPECPLCRNYTLVLNELQHKFETSLQLIGIIPGVAYEDSAIAEYARDYKLRFPLFNDPGRNTVAYTKATITPEVILINQKGVVVYRGAIDDWVAELGKKKRQADNHYLADAIQQYIAGAPVAVKRTQPKGCYINEF